MLTLVPNTPQEDRLTSDMLALLDDMADALDRADVEAAQDVLEKMREIFS